MSAEHEYQEYLRSEHWQRFRKLYRSLRPMQCEPCWQDWEERYRDVPEKERPMGMFFEPIELHHKTYERRGREDLDDVEPLCRDHHRLRHGRSS